MTDPYKILDIEPSATWMEVKSAYKVLVQLYHPDKHTNQLPSVKNVALKKFSEIQNAYETIESIHKKKQELEQKRKKTQEERREKSSKQREERKSFEKIIKRAEQGIAQAQYILGLMYEDGQGVPQDYPLRYRCPKLHCADAIPCSAERRYHLTASCELIL